MIDSKMGGCTGAKVASTLLWVGGINWGLVGLGMILGKGDAWNLVNILLGSMPTLEAVVYVLVGVAAVMKCFHCKCGACSCSGGSCSCGSCKSSTQDM